MKWSWMCISLSMYVHSGCRIWSSNRFGPLFTPCDTTKAWVSNDTICALEDASICVLWNVCHQGGLTAVSGKPGVDELSLLFPRNRQVTAYAITNFNFQIKFLWFHEVVVSGHWSRSVLRAIAVDWNPMEARYLEESAINSGTQSKPDIPSSTPCNFHDNL